MPKQQKLLYTWTPIAVVVQLLSPVWLFATLWTAACQASLFTTSWNLIKCLSIEVVMLSNYLIFCLFLFLLPRISIFSNESSHQVDKVLGASVSTSVFSINIQGWFPLGLTGLISLQFKGLSRIFSNTTIRKQLFHAQLSLWSNSHISTWLLEKP